MAKQSDTQLVKKDENAAALAEISAEFGGSDLVDVRRDMIKVPRLKLAQALSPAVSGGLTKTGNFFCELTGQDFGTEVKFIPIMVKESASLMKKGSSEVLCRTRNLIENDKGDLCSNCPFNEYWKDWGTKHNPKTPGCKTSFDVLGLVDGIAVPVIFSFRKTSYKAGKALMNFISFDPLKVPFGTEYTFKSIMRENGAKQKFFTVDEDGIARERLSVDQVKEILPLIRSIIQKSKENKLDQEEDGDDVAPSDSENDIIY